MGGRKRGREEVGKVGKKLAVTIQETGKGMERREREDEFALSLMPWLTCVISFFLNKGTPLPAPTSLPPPSSTPSLRSLSPSIFNRERARWRGVTPRASVAFTSVPTVHIMDVFSILPSFTKLEYRYLL